MDIHSFLCPSCTTARQQAAIASQQEDIARLREYVSSLTDEVRELKATVATMQSQSLPLTGQANANASTSALPWSTVVKKGSNNRRWNSGSKSRIRSESQQGVENAPQQSPERNVGSHTKPKASKSMAGKERVQGVRRLWGTLKTTSVHAVKSALTKLTSVGDAVSIKRKYKSLDSSSHRIRWWFVMRADETTFATLEQEWHKVALQLSWKIEPCFMPSQNLDGPDKGLESTLQSDAPVESHTASNTGETELEPVSKPSVPTPEVSTNTSN